MDGKAKVVMEMVIEVVIMCGDDDGMCVCVCVVMVMEMVIVCVWIVIVMVCVYGDGDGGSDGVCVGTVWPAPGPWAPSPTRPAEKLGREGWRVRRYN